MFPSPTSLLPAILLQAIQELAGCRFSSRKYGKWQFFRNSFGIEFIETIILKSSDVVEHDLVVSKSWREFQGYEGKVLNAARSEFLLIHGDLEQPHAFLNPIHNTDCTPYSCNKEPRFISLCISTVYILHMILQQWRNNSYPWTLATRDIPQKYFGVVLVVDRSKSFYFYVRVISVTFYWSSRDIYI